MYNNELQNQDLHPTTSEQMVELNENELDTVAGGGDIGDAFQDFGRGVGRVAGDVASAPFRAAFGLGEGLVEGFFG